MYLVLVHCNHNLFAAAALGGGGNASHQVLTLIGHVQVDLGAHQLGNLNLGADMAVGMLFKEFLVVLDVLRTDADLQALADVSVQLAVCGLFGGQGDVGAGQVNHKLVAVLLQGAVQEVHLGAADKAGNAVATVSVLSSSQLDEVDKKRTAYLSEKPNPADEQAIELTNRLLATAAVELHNAYLPQLRNVYAPIDPSIEYPTGFNADNNIRFMIITKWVVDPNEDSLEKLVNVYDVLSDEDCNIALVFNRTSASTEVFLAVVNSDNARDNIDADNFSRRMSDALRGNFPGSEVGPANRGPIPCLDNRRSSSVAAVSNIPAEKNEKFVTQTIEKVLDGIVPGRPSEDYTIVLLATPIHDIESRKLRLAELHSLLTP